MSRRRTLKIDLWPLNSSGQKRKRNVDQFTIHGIILHLILVRGGFSIFGQIFNNSVKDCLDDDVDSQQIFINFFTKLLEKYQQGLDKLKLIFCFSRKEVMEEFYKEVWDEIITKRRIYFLLEVAQ
eukprot:TRINITY_DN5352_c0_g1_i8.p1 TRINITY_DN5352_c0_g1~~TRINITY_DN5352_c0_g1_i8.p1  ORF type:complete len:125 (+),score=22.06 TRINITY_DN5352_c0_g1_i8:221-595(+)